MIRATGSIRPVSPSRSPGRAIAAALLAISCASLAACRSSGEGLGVESRQFQDVVVPAGFQLRDRAHESFSREEATWRQGHFVYVGGARVDEAASYVQQRMPQHGWQVMPGQTPEQVPEGDEVRLRFERGIYAADYLFRRTEGSTHMIVDYTTDFSRR
jgi:hypothetical protein